MAKSLEAARQQTNKRATSASHIQIKNQVPFAATSVHHLLKLQQQFGNGHVMRQLADMFGDNTSSAVVKRDDTSAPTDSVEPPLKEVTVPIPPQHPIKAPSAPAGTGGEPSIVPDEAKIRIPLDFDYHLLPPEFQIRLLDEFSLTAKVTEANLQWQRERLKFGLDYQYGGALMGMGSYRSDVGIFSGKASYVPGASNARFDLGFDRDRLHVGAYGTTSGEYEVGLSYGMKPLPTPDELATSLRTGEQGTRNVLNDLPDAADPTRLPDTLKTHKDDFKNIGKAVSPIVDLAKRDTSHIDWGFYLRFSKGPYQPSALYAPYYQGFTGQEEYKVGVGIVGQF